MASSSSSSTSHRWKYDVFLSFKGKDTRDGFLSHLYADLLRNDIETFMDDQLGGGEPISPALLKTIEESNISIVVFSKNYADSPWCLEEPEKIVECKENLEQKVLPVFYQVDPTEVQELSGSYGDGLAQLRQQSGSDKVERWSRALKEISNLKGWDSNNIKPETKLIQQIVNDVLTKLEDSSPRNIDNFDNLVGIDSRVKEVESLLYIGSPEPKLCIVGIWGMGGIGKTTIAKTLFNRISCQFKRKFFCSNVRQAIQMHGLVSVKDEILRNIHSTWRMIQKTNALIVLDDVDKSEQLIDLVGYCALYGSGSRIIVTSRDKQLLETSCHKIYAVQKLNHEEALQLFQLHAFKQNHYEESFLALSEKVVNLVDGVPLALVVLGCDLYKKGIKEWKSKLAKLQKIPHLEITNVLKISYDGLDRDEKNIFLDIACFFNGCVEDYVEEILDNCGFFVVDGIRHLIDKALITFENNKRRMHDLIQQMGQEIVSQESNEPGKRSRLWSDKDICDVLKDETGTRRVQTMCLNTATIEEIRLPPITFKGLSNLRLLKFYNYHSSGKIKLYLPNGLEYLPNKLVLLRWDQYPLKSLPANFFPENLVTLDLSKSYVERLWDGDKIHLRNLKILNLRNSIYLTTVPDFSKMINLESINLAGCRCLVELPSSIGHLSQLVSLDLRNCERLEGLPNNIGQLECLTRLWLIGCSMLLNLPHNIGKLKCLRDLNLWGCSMLSSLPDSIGQLKCLEYITLAECSMLISLPDNIGELKCLIDLSLQGCSLLASLPDSIGKLKNLKRLNPQKCSMLESVPNSIGQLKRLENLWLNECSMVVTLPSSLGKLKFLTYLYLEGCTKLASLPNSIGKLKNLTHLFLDGCFMLTSLPCSICNLQSIEILSLLECANLNELPENMGNLPSLQSLEISKASYMTKLPSSFTQLSGLVTLSLEDCGISEIPNNLSSLVWLECLNLRGNNFENIHTSIRQLCNLQELDLSDCKRLKFLPELPPSLLLLDAPNCTSLRSVPNLFKYYELKYANFGGCYNLDCRKIMDDDALHLINFPRTDFRLLVPGSGGPQWFKHKQKGSPLEVELLGQNGCDEFLKCAVVAFHEGSEDLYFVQRTTEPECIMNTDHLFLWSGMKNFDMNWLSKVDVIEFGMHPKSGSGREEEEKEENDDDEDDDDDDDDDETKMKKRKRMKTDGNQEMEEDAEVEPYSKISKKETNQNQDLL